MAKLSTGGVSRTSLKRREVITNRAKASKKRKLDISQAGGRKHATTPNELRKSRNVRLSKDPTTTTTSLAHTEKRARRYRSKATGSFLEKLHRAQTQRMIVIGRRRIDTEDFLQEAIDIVGSTGNIYQVTIGKVPSCTCPDHLKGNECKHKVYALHTVLKAPQCLQYQLAFLTSELAEIFGNAPPIPTEVPSSGDTDGNRKDVEGECPICYMDFDPIRNELVWCRAACGNNMHKSCFEQWVASQRGATVRCVYCRTPWQVNPGDVDKIATTGSVGADGYVNVAEQFGMSGTRDYSTYHPFWVRQHLGMGW